MFQPLRPLSLVPALLLAGCGPSTFNLPVHVWGEDYIEQGIPAQAAEGEDGFIDGWSVTFSSFLIQVNAIQVDAKAVDTAQRLSPMPEAWIVDLSRNSNGAGQLLRRFPVPSGSTAKLAYTVGRADAAVQLGGSNAEVAELEEAGASIRVQGEARRADEVKTFTWAFTGRTRYSECQGSSVAGEDGAKATLTIHADHLFYDDLASEEPNLAFDLIASADVDGDGDVTEAELRAVDLRTQERYQVGNTGITNLWDFIAWQSTTLGHIDGEGHCGEATRLP